MARLSVAVDRGQLERAIIQAEMGGPLANRGALWGEVARIYDTAKVTPAVVMLRVQEWQISVKTPKGKRGRISGQSVDTSKNKRKRIQLHTLSYDEQLKITPKQYASVLVRAKAGSVKASVKLKCLECSCWDKREVKQCQVTACALFPIRPYQ